MLRGFAGKIGSEKWARIKNQVSFCSIGYSQCKSNSVAGGKGILHDPALLAS
jgi:carbonic anhydrase